MNSSLRDEVIEVAKALVSTPNVQKVAEVTTKFLTDKGIEVNKLTYDDLPIIIARLEGHNCRKPILLTTHMDVATPGPLNFWHYSPFSAKLRGDKLFGRGSSDSKGGLASAVVTLRRLASSNVKIERDVVLLALPDGEDRYDSLSAVKKLKGFSAIVVEPTLSTSTWTAPIICNAQLGRACLEINIKGIPSHISTSWYAKNPLMSLAKVLSIIDKVWPSHPFYPTRPETASEDLLSSFLFGLPTITPIEVRARSKAQSTPDSVILRIHSTLPPNYTANDILARLRAQEVENVSIKVVEEIPFFMEDARAEIVKTVHYAIKDVTGLNPLYEWFPWSTSAYILKTNGIADEVVIVGPGDMRLAHRPNEYVNIKDLLNAVKIFMKVAKGDLDVPSDS